MITTYTVNEEKRTVVCRIEYPVDYCEMRKVIGIAYCSKDDVWNEDLGRRLAAARAQAEMHLALRKIELSTARDYQSKAKQFTDKAARHDKIHKNYRERVKKLRQGILED